MVIEIGNHRWPPGWSWLLSKAGVLYFWGLLTAILDCNALCDKNGELHFEVGALTSAVAITKDTNVSDLAAGPRVLLAFHLMNIGWDFLRLEPEKWNYQRKLADYASCIRVTNNLAKRAVPLFSLYYGKFTRVKIWWALSFDSVVTYQTSPAMHSPSSQKKKRII